MPDWPIPFWGPIHSLIIDPQTIPDCLEIDALADDEVIWDSSSRISGIWSPISSRIDFDCRWKEVLQNFVTFIREYEEKTRDKRWN